MRQAVSSNSPRVLLVEDDALLGDSIAQAIQRLGCLCDIAANGDMALTLATKPGYQVVITDTEVTGTDGLTLIDHLRALQPKATFLAATRTASQAPPEHPAISETIALWDDGDIERQLHDALTRNDNFFLGAPPSATLLIAEDDHHSGKTLEDYLEARGFRTLWAKDGAEAISAFQDHRVDLALVDVMMPRVDGYEVCRAIKSGRLGLPVPVIFVTAKGSGADKVTGFDCEADGYITKPYDLVGLEAEVDARLRAQQRFQSLVERTELLYDLSQIDELTGLYNRRFFYNRLDYELRRAQRYGRQLSLLSIDLDRFKHANDTHGHLFGDAILQQVAVLIHENVRSIDITGRCGGDEFLVMLPDTDASGALHAAERIRVAIRNHVFTRPDSCDDAHQPEIPDDDGPTSECATARLTATIGVTTCAKGRYPRSRKAFLGWADEALYQAKGERTRLRRAVHDQPTLARCRVADRIEYHAVGNLRG